jgi:hypothetical protein
LAEAALACIRDAGWEAEMDWTGGINGPEMNSAQVSQWQAVAAKCTEQAGYTNPQLTDAQKRQLYAQEVAERDCLAGLGYVSDPPPSEQRYVDTWGTGEQYAAFFAAGADKTGQAEMMKTVRECPPPSWFLNLDGF